MAFAPATTVQGPVRLPLPYGLFSVVSLAEAVTERWENGVNWQALTCDPVAIVVGDCDDPTGFPMEFPEECPPWGEADAFTVYGTARFTPIAGDLAEGQRLAREVLLAREQAAVEAQVWSLLQAGTPTVVTGGTAARALGDLEKWIGDVYGSLGVIHASRNAATTLVDARLIKASSGGMYTELGTPVVVGAGYDGSDEGGDPPSSGTEFIAASPAMFGYRSQVIEDSNRPGDLMDRTTNDLYGIAERNYLIGIDPCGTAFASLTLG